SLGMVLYEMLAGRRPFVAESPDELFAEQRRADPPPLPLDLDIPASLEGTVMRLMHRDPAKRYASARDAMEALATAMPAVPAPRSFAPRKRSGTSAVHDAADWTQDLARRAFRGLVDLGGAAADLLTRPVPFRRAGKTLRVPVWALVTVPSVPLVF